MLKEHVRQQLNPPLTPWHITFGTYGTRLHGNERPTVDRQHNILDTPFITQDPHREEFERGRMKFPPRYFTTEQRLFVESSLPEICTCGGWSYRTCAAAPDHVHLLCDVPSEVHGEKVRRLVKRWLGQELSDRWPLPEGAVWWAEEGSNKAIDNEDYLNNCFKYIFDQRATPVSQVSNVGAEDGPARCSGDFRQRAGSSSTPALLPPTIYHFHLNVFAKPPLPFAVTWEAAAAALERLPRMIFELDGSFVITGETKRAGSSPTPIEAASTHRWQVDGHLFDFDGRLHRVELHGQCPPASFDDLLRCIGWPAQSLLFEMVREGETLDESEMRRRIGVGDDPARC